MSDRPGRLQADEIVLAPLVFLPADFVTDPEPVVGSHRERAHIQPECALLGGEGIQRHNDKDRVTGHRVELAKGQQSVVIDVMEPDGAQLTQRRVQPSDLIEPGEEWLQ